MAHTPLCKVHKGREVLYKYIPLDARVQSQTSRRNGCISAPATACNRQGNWGVFKIFIKMCRCRCPSLQVALA